METSRRPRDDTFLPLVSSADWGGRATRAEVNLDALAGNVQSFRRLVGETTLMAVLKANAYGHGAVEVARAALASGAQWLGVYTVEEGISLREHGIEAPVLIFGPFEAREAADIWRYRLRPTVTGTEGAESLQRTASGPPLPFHVKIDTGLSRAGVAPWDAVALMERLRGFAALQPEGIYTHFASADEPWNDLTHRQLGVFLQTVDQLSQAGHTITVKHAANSAGTLAFPDSHLDMVRVGIGLYGYYPWGEGSGDEDGGGGGGAGGGGPLLSRARPTDSPDRPTDSQARPTDSQARPTRSWAGPVLRPALRLVSRLTRVHRIPAGTGVGYGHEFRCSRDSTIGLAPIGYGDGLPRSLGNGAGTVIVRGRCAPIVGRVSMDQITIDVTDVPGASVGDSVTLIGEEGGVCQTADRLGEQAGTISYDILTGLLPRVPRLYVRHGQVVSISGMIPSPPLATSPASEESGE